MVTKGNRPQGKWFACGDNGDFSCARERARCFRRSLLLVMLLLAMVPLSVKAGLSFYQYHNLLQEETYNSARWSAQNATQAVEAFVEKLQAAILVVLDAYSVESLSDQHTLDQVFSRLKDDHQGLVDLSLIDPDGVQVSYSGIYDLAGKDYTRSSWYSQALGSKAYVSEVILGYRNVPHFVIAASKRNTTGKGYWLLRASIDAKTLDQFLALVHTEIVDDMFLINEGGKLQSSSRYYNAQSAPVLLQLPPRKSGVTLMVVEREAQRLIRAVANVRGTPWILVQDQQRLVHRQSWSAFKNQMLWFFLITLLVVAVAAYRIADVMADKIRKSDESREMLLRETEHTNKLASIGRLAAGVAHEINNPLAIINEKTGLMKDLLQGQKDFVLRDKFLAQLDALENAVIRSRTITHRLLGFARRMEVSLESIQIVDVIRDVLGFLDKEAIYKNIVIETYFEPELTPIKSDRSQLQQIFLNIINNAIDAVGEGGEISISCQQAGKGMIQVDISDNGPGIAPEDLNAIFEPFFTTKKGGQKSGTGLGLSITYGLMKKLGGKITVYSERGIGTTFSLVFPVAAPNGMGDDYE